MPDPARAHYPEGILKQILTGPVQALLTRGLGSSHESIPRQFMDFGIVNAAIMRHQQRHIIASGAYVKIHQ